MGAAGASAGAGGKISGGRVFWNFAEIAEGSGKNAARAIARKMNLLLPGMRRGSPLAFRRQFRKNRSTVHFWAG